MADTDMDKKQLVLVVEGTPTMALYWQTILYEYLHKIIKSFCGNHDMVAVNNNVELGLVIFNDYMSLRYGLTSDMKVLFDWLSSINFDSGTRGFNATIVNGLYSALMLFDSTNVRQNGHCILVSASNPNPPVYEQLEKSKTVAKSLSECGISLSVIGPEHYPILKEIYNAGKENRSVTDHTIDIDEYPQHLVLISENLMKDCGDLSQAGFITVLQNSLTARDLVNWKPVPEHVQGPSSQTSEHVPFGSPDASVLNKWSSQVRLDIPMGISTIGGISVAEYSYVSGSSSRVISQPLYGNNEARHSIPETGTMMPPPLLMSPEQVLSQSSHVKVWEGDLYCLDRGQPVFMARFEGYQMSPSSTLVAADWPPTMLIESRISQDYMNNKELVDKADIFVFRSMNQLIRKLVELLQESNECAVIRLPTKVLVLVAASDQPDELFGLLFPYDMNLKYSSSSNQHQQGRVSL